MKFTEIVILQFDDAAPLDQRVKFWDGKRFVADRAHAMVYPSDRIAVPAFDRVVEEVGNAQPLALVENYGRDDEFVIDR